MNMVKFSKNDKVTFVRNNGTIANGKVIRTFNNKGMTAFGRVESEGIVVEENDTKKNFIFSHIKHTDKGGSVFQETDTISNLQAV